MKQILISFLVIVTLITCLIKFVASKGDYVEPLNMGLQMAVPYDLANIFIKPIAAAISVFLSIAMLFILVFGVITSPFGYFFGIPSRKYVLGGTDAEAHGEGRSGSRSFSFQNYFSNDQESDAWNMTKYFDEERIQKLKQLEVKKSLLFLLPPDVDEECNSLLVCYSHGLVRKMPAPVLQIFQFFSRRLLNGEDKIKEAIKVGLSGVKSCEVTYTGCPYSAFKLTIKALRNVLPNWWRNTSTKKYWKKNTKS